jgi:hypothetical protein
VNVSPPFAGHHGRTGSAEVMLERVEAHMRQRCLPACHRHWLGHRRGKGGRPGQQGTAAHRPTNVADVIASVASEQARLITGNILRLR